MSTRTTFEDRLLAELKREIGLREARPGGSGPARAGTGGGRTSAVVRRPGASRRIAVVAGACAAAWLAAVVLPGSHAGQKAYAVEGHGDGSVTLTVKEQELDIEAQHQLARDMHPWGIQVSVEVLDPGYVCERDRGKVPEHWTIGKGGTVEAFRVLPARSQITLRRGNLLVFENTRGQTLPKAINAYAVRRDYEPCVPVKPARRTP